ncbi:MAG: peptidylprolyl isomerase [Verrucomicrobia bacterium]|nr:peptidylprolyl isomerase [Cytophagales bacterium]
MTNKYNFLLLFLSFILVFTTAFAQKKSSKDYLVTITTDFGEAKLILYDQTPKHKANFIKLAQKKFYDGLLFHRIIEGFMIQGGDPTSKNATPEQSLGDGNVGYTVPAEFDPKIFHKKGVIAAARDDRPDKASSGCQFYIVQGKKFTDDMFPAAEKRSGRIIPEDQKQIYRTLGGTPHLDMNYTAYGEVISGLEMVDKIAAQSKNTKDRPQKDIRMKVSVEKMRKKKITKLYGYQF